MIRHPSRNLVETLIKTRLEENGTNFAFINTSNFLFILESVVDIGDNEEKTDEKSALIKKAAYLVTKTIELHPLVDGNKRAAAILSEFFLAVNGQQLVTSQDEFYDVLLGFARRRRELKENDIGNWLANNVKTMTQEFNGKQIQIEQIKSTLNAEEQKEFDLGLQVTENRKELYKKLAKT